MSRGPLIKQLEATPWKSKGACVGLGPRIFFPASKKDDAVNEAKAVCRSCSVREECLDYSLKLPADQRDHGVWGGATREERDNIRKSRRKRQAS